MALSNVDRDSTYMKKAWGTTRLITDYVNSEQKVLQEVMYDPEAKVKKQNEELFEENDDISFDYGIEPTYKIKRGQTLL